MSPVIAMPHALDTASLAPDPEPGNVPRPTSRELALALKAALGLDDLRPGRVLTDIDVELIKAVAMALRGEMAGALARQSEDPMSTQQERGGTGAWRFEAAMDDQYRRGVRQLAVWQETFARKEAADAPSA